MVTQARMSVVACPMLGIVNWALTRENMGICEHQGAYQPVHPQSDQHFSIRLLENIVSRLASIKYTQLFPITVVSSMIDLILSFSPGVGLID